MNRNILILLDKTLFQGLFYLVAFWAKRTRPKKETLTRADFEKKHFLIIRPGGIGDGLMSLPMLKTLRAAFPTNRVTFICLKKNKLAYQHVSYFDELIVLDTRAGLFRMLSLFSKRTIDVVFDLEPFRKVSAILAYLSGASVRVGFDTNARRGLFSHLVSYPNEKYYESFNMMRQLQVLGVDVSQEMANDLSFDLPSEHLQEARSLLASEGVSPGTDFVVAIVPGVLKDHHRWQMPRFAELITRMKKNDASLKVLMLGVAADVPDATTVMAHLPRETEVVNLVGKTSYTASLGILKYTDILVACDGGVVYMAAAMGCSTLSIWGPGVMDRFKPRGDRHIGIRKDYVCVPCVNYSRLGEFPECPDERMCINDISSEDVFESYTVLRSRMQKNGKPMQSIGNA